MPHLSRILLIACFTLTLGALAHAAPSADEILGKAKVQAAEEHKNIFLMFDASW